MENRIAVLREHINGVLLSMSDALHRGEWYHAYIHLYGVAQACTLIAMKRGQEAELATMAGMLHDFYTYKHRDPRGHAHKGAVLAREVLGELNLTTAEETECIYTAIYNHSDKGGRFDAFTEILIDADVMQHCLYDITMPVAERERDRFQRLCEEFGLHGRYQI